VNPQAYYDNDSGTSERQELAQEWVAEHIADVCEAHPGCEHLGVHPHPICLLSGEFVDSMDGIRCIHYDDAVAKRMEAMRDE
jgi:hypothetical protein